MSVTFKVHNHIGFVEFDDPDRKVNILTGDVLRRLDAILDEAAAKDGLKAVVFQSGKPGVFLAGADIQEIAGITIPGEGEMKAKFGQHVFNKIEDLSVPTIALIDGVTLGGGCELVLACRYRVATFSEKVKIGLPEVNLGILPGFGGTYRMPRLVGLADGLTLILSATPVDGAKALKIGLVDRLLPAARLEHSILEFVAEVASLPLSRPRRRQWKTWTQRVLEETPLGHAVIFRQARKNVWKKTKGLYPAPLKVLALLKRSLSEPRTQALTMEAQAFGELVVTDICKNLISVFFLSEKFRKQDPPVDAPSSPPVRKAGVIGAGIMGGGIAQLMAYKDIDVRMKDISYPALGLGMRSAAKLFREAVKRRKLSAAQAQMKMGRIIPGMHDTGWPHVDAVIEAVVENLDVKKKVFAEISRKIPPDALLCSNTSALSVTAMAEAAEHPERVVGFHFFNPVHRMPLVEIVQGRLSSPAAIAGAFALARQLGKTPVLVQDSPGFLVNRILLSYINEAGLLLEEGAGVEFLDDVMLNFGMPMGPLLLSDEVGLDVGLKVLCILNAGLGARFCPAAVFERVVAEGLLGKKSGSGFYIHRGRQRKVNPRVDEFRAPVRDEQFSVVECMERMVYVMVNEAARCLDDGIVGSAEAVDIAMIMGTGFPPLTGGLLRFADQTGIKYVVQSLQMLAEKHGERFIPAPSLQMMAKTGKKFYQK